MDSLDVTQRIPRWKTVLDATSWPDRGTLVVADELAGIVGFANLRPSRDADHDPDDVGEIASFYVDPDA